MDPQYTFWLVTGAVGIMVGALAWFMKRLISELEAKIARSEKATGERMDSLEKRMEKQEDRYDNLLKQLPEKYALRDDLIRMSQNISAEIGQLRDLIINALREREGPEMLNKLDLIKRKQLRGDIVITLYDQYGRSPAEVSWLINAFTGKTCPLAETEVPAQLFYLADPQKGFVTISYRDGNEPELTPLRNAYVQLTAAGVNLYEGDIDDPGVIFGDGQRY